MKWTATLLVAFLSVTSGCSGRKSKGVEIAKKDSVPPPSEKPLEGPNDPFSDPGGSINDGLDPQDPGTTPPETPNPFNPDLPDPNGNTPNPFTPDSNPGGTIPPYTPPDFSNPGGTTPPGSPNTPDTPGQPDSPGTPGTPGPPNVPGTPQGNNGDLNIKFDFNDPNLTTWDGKSDVTNGSFKIIDIP